MNAEKNHPSTEIGYVDATTANEQILLEQLLVRCKSKEADKYNFVLRYTKDRKRVTIVRILRRLTRLAYREKLDQRKEQQQ